MKIKIKNKIKKQDDTFDPTIQLILSQIGTLKLFEYAISQVGKLAENSLAEAEGELFYAKHETNSYALAKQEARQRAVLLKKQHKIFLKCQREFETTFTKFKEVNGY